MGRRSKIAALVVGGVVFAVLLASGVFFATLLFWGDGPRAEQALLKGNYVAALDGYNRALASRYLPKAYRVSFLVGRGAAQLGLNNPDLAIASYDAALAIAPNSAKAIALRGVAHMNKGELQAAIFDLSAALRLTPDDMTFQMWRAQAYDSLLDFDRAASDYTAVTKRAPQMLSAYRRAAYNESRKGDISAAISIIDSIPVGDTYNANIYLARGDAYEFIGAPDRSILEIGQAIRLDPNSADAYAARGLAYSDIGNHALAMADYAYALMLSPSDGRTYFVRGLEEYLSGNYRAAADDFRQAIKFNPKYAYESLWLYLALVHRGEATSESLTESAAHVDRKAWPWPVVEYFLGRRDRASLRASAKNDKDPSKTADYACEAEYYIGALDLAEGKTALALPVIRRAASLCPPGFIELRAAKAELKRLDR